MTDLPLGGTEEEEGYGMLPLQRDGLQALPVPPVMTPASLVQAFLSARKQSTLSAYRQDLESLRRYLEVESVADGARILFGLDAGQANAVVLGWRNALIERGLASATVARRLSAVKSLAKLARILGLVTWKIEIESPKVEKLRDTRGPGRQGVEAIFEVLNAMPGPRTARNKAIVHLLFDLALRRGEAVSLDLEHLDLPNERAWILGKGRTQRMPLTLPERTQEAIRAWLLHRGLEPGPLFSSMNITGVGDGRLTGRSVGRIVNELGLLARIGHARAHGLRHAAITDALDRTGGDVRAVAKFSRHRDVNQVMRYDDARRDQAGEIARLVAEGGAVVERSEDDTNGDRG